MALPASGTISFSQVNTELGRAAGATISLNETVVRTLAGKASGTISMADLRGKSSGPSFSPTDSNVIVSGTTSGSRTLNSSMTAVWTYSKVSGANLTMSVANGGSALALTMTMTNNSAFVNESTYNVTATVGGQSKTWNVYFQLEGTGGGS